MQMVMGDLLIMLATFLWATYSWMLSRPGSSSEREWPLGWFLVSTDCDWFDVDRNF
jgi:drug/metabolite transporter (DMT)-like permease